MTSLTRSVTSFYILTGSYPTTSSYSNNVTTSPAQLTGTLYFPGNSSSTDDILVYCSIYDVSGTSGSVDVLVQTSIGMLECFLKPRITI